MERRWRSLSGYTIAGHRLILRASFRGTVSLKPRVTMHPMRRAICLLSGFCLLSFTACGHGATAHNLAPAQSFQTPSSQSPQVLVSSLLDCLSPGYNYDRPSQGSPVPDVLAVDRSCGQGRLQGVTATVKPALSGSDAYQRCLFCPDGQATDRAMTEELAYYSASTPATVPSECVPEPNTQVPPQCIAGAASPWYEHTLVWFFVWKANCPPMFGPPGPQRPETLVTCVWFTEVDASTGKQGMLASG
jgi:hypothetical protein